MLENRKTIKNLAMRALRKCSQFYRNGLYAYCTPAEYVALCVHFRYVPQDLGYYQKQVADGVSGNGPHYIRVNKWYDVFPKHRFFIDTDMG